MRFIHFLLSSLPQMWVKTEGILLHAIKHTDSSRIIKVYTEEFGYRSFVFRVPKGKAARNVALLQSFTLLEFDTQIRENKDLHPMKNVRGADVFPTLHSDIYKRSILMFMAELVYKSLEDSYLSNELFDFLKLSLYRLDQTEHVANFHLWFMLQLSRHYGFYPTNNWSSSRLIFDLMQAEFVSQHGERETQMPIELSQKLHGFLGTIFDEIHTFEFSSENRFEMLEYLIKYYQVHLDGMRTLNSHEVFKTVFNT